MTANELRRRFLAFFNRNGHTIVPSDSLIPAKDPTLLFTGAGMNPFKEYFLGLKRDFSRAASCQKCFRTGDVEQVGLTPSHLTFFEMLGNFSFGDYFKEEAIRLAWEFMTQELRLSPEKLWASVYEEDEEAFSVWKEKIGLPSERILRFGAKENFWPSNAPTQGPDGPCGPCSELYYDYERCMIGKTCPDPDHCAPGCPCGRFVEVWNLVFTQFDRKSDGKLDPLPAKNIDTGMGLERLSAVMQGKMSVFETDLFELIIESMVHTLREEAPDELKVNQRSFVYAMVDHVRALTFLVCDGVVPSNEGRGYVLRMLLRRAERHGMSLGLKKPFLYRLVPSVAKVMKEPYPELTERRESIAKAILAEEERFHETLREKLPLLQEEVKKSRHFPAERAAYFYDTHGLAFEEIAEACRKGSVQPPQREDFEEALANLQAESKAKSGFSGAIWTKDTLMELISDFKQPTQFLGYEELKTQARVLGIIQENHLLKEAKDPALIGLILDRSPFYGEAGGQVGDSGTIQAPEGRMDVLDTQWEGSLLIHQVKLIEGRVKVNDPVEASVDPIRRRRVAQNHTGTHLLHAALRKVLGEHVVQAGSLVAPDRIRFDFSHGQAVPRRHLENVEQLVNEWVEATLPVQAEVLPLDEAKRRGALALFGEKYGEEVRLVSIGEVSKELCGGTHLTTSGEVGLFKLIEEGSVAAGVRRVTALTGRGAFERLKSEWQELEELAQDLKTQPNDLPQTLGRLTRRLNFLGGELKRRMSKGVEQEARKLAGTKTGWATFFAKQISQPLDHATLRVLSDSIRKLEPQAVIFLCDAEGNAVAAVGEEPQKRGILAGQLIELATQIAGGSGGGSPQLAQGRLKDASRFTEVKKQLEQWVDGRIR